MENKEQLTRSVLEKRIAGFRKTGKELCRPGSPEEQFYVGYASALEEILDQFFWNPRLGAPSQEPEALESLVEAAFVMRERQTHPELTTPEKTSEAEEALDAMLAERTHLTGSLKKMPWLYKNQQKDTEGEDLPF